GNRDAAALLEVLVAGFRELVPGLDVDEDGSGVAVEAGDCEPDPADALAGRGGVGLGVGGEAADQLDGVHCLSPFETVGLVPRELAPAVPGRLCRELRGCPHPQ